MSTKGWSFGKHLLAGQSGGPCQSDLKGLWHGKRHVDHRSSAPRWSTSLLPIVLLAAPPVLSAQTVGGRLIDDATAAAVVDADIALLDDGGAVVDSTLTAADGSFSLRAPEAGEYTIRAAHIAYATAVSPTLSLQRGDTLEVEFRVAPRVVPLAPLTVVSRRRETTVRDPRLERRGYYERKARYGKEGMVLASPISSKVRTSGRPLSFFRTSSGTYQASMSARRAAGMLL
jgi:hypothetical protein